MPPREPRPLRGRRKDLEWYDGAACRGMDTNRFFPERGAQSVPEDIARMCRSCPVLDDCRSFAVARFELSGTWGGMTYDERRRLRRQIKRRAS